MNCDINWLREGAYPISGAILRYFEKNPCVYQSLRMSNRERFTLIPTIITSHLPYSHMLSKDEVIGLWYFDRESRPCPYRQDYLVNKDKGNSDFIAYVADVDYIACPSGQGHTHVQLTRDFFHGYGSSGKYYSRENHKKPWMHHYDSVDELPRPIKETICEMNRLS